MPGGLVPERKGEEMSPVQDQQALAFGVIKLGALVEVTPEPPLPVGAI